MMDEIVMALAIEHLKRGEVIAINGIKYAAEKRPMEKALCSECPMHGESRIEDANQIPICILCLFLAWLERKQPYKVRVKKVER